MSADSGEFGLRAGGLEPVVAPEEVAAAPPAGLVAQYEAAFAGQAERARRGSQAAAAARELVRPEAAGRREPYSRQDPPVPAVSLPAPVPGHDQLGPTSLGPPYAFSWPWTAETGGGGAVAELDPQEQPGTMYVRASWNSGATTASAWMVEGHFFQATGRLAMVSALPSVWYDWYFGCSFEAAHTDGAIGMFVGAYDSQWQWLGPIVDVPVGDWWSHSGSALDNNQNYGSITGYPLSAVVANLEPGFHYAVGVKIGVDASSNFGGIFSSNANGIISARPPSITWTP
jgi:hypothetical protein